MPQQSLSAKREVLQAVVAITTLPAAELTSVPAAKEIEHDSEVARSEAVTVVVTIQGCQPDARVPATPRPMSSRTSRMAAFTAR